MGDRTMFSMSFAPVPLSLHATTSLGAGTETGGLDQLLAALEAAQVGFSAELQPLLQQMNPPILERLESMLAGGMTLPQAARQLLSESIVGRQPGIPQAFPDGGAAKPAVLDRPEPTAVVATRADNGSREPPRIVLPTNASGAVSFASPIVSLLVPGMPPVAMPVQSNPVSPQLTTSLLDMGVPQPVGGRDWQGAIADRIVWMAQGDQQFARLTLNPPHLGPLEVRVSVSQDQTSVHFLAGHAAVRDALEAAIPRLRDLFDQQSMSLIHAEVSDPGAQRDRRAGSSAHMSGRVGGADDENSMVDPGTDTRFEPAVVQGRGLVDLFV